MAELVWSNQARADLLDIYVSLGLENPTAAEKYFALIEAKATTLVAHPHVGVRRPDIRPSARMLVASPYLILYRMDPDTDDDVILSVEIIRIVDGRRELARLF